MKDERWVDIQGWEGIYQISDYGRLKSFKQVEAGRILSNKNKNGDYFSVVLSLKGRKQKYTRIHRLVAEYFVPNRENKPHVNHIDGNKQNNYYKNLEWVTPKENMDHAVCINPDFINGMKYYNQIVRPRSIIQLTLGGEFIAKFNNTKEAARETGVCYRNIYSVAAKEEYKPGLTRKQAGGFKWEFYED